MYWYQELPRITRKYNLTIHATTGKTPYDLHMRRLLIKNTPHELHGQYKEGDKVRVRRLPNDPKFKPNEGGFKITKVIGNNLYEVTDGDITLRRSGKQLQPSL